MANDNKQAYLANFNCTFGENHVPLLPHFFDIVYPAFIKESEDEDKKKKFLIENVKLSRIRGHFMLTGIIIRRTTLEVKSVYRNGKLIKTNDRYKSDPYSYFIINLNNHRMVIVKNQNGSPTLSNFSLTANMILKKFVREKNKELEKENKLPFPNLNVVAIPFEGKIREELKKVKKVNQVVLRFYPLNGDIMDNETVDHLLKSLGKLEGNSGNITYNTPKNKDAVAEVIDDTKGLMKPTINVEYENGTKGRLNDNAFTEVMNIGIEESESLAQNMDSIVGKVVNKEEFSEVSEENKSLYDKFYSKLESLYNKFINP